jgi:hypothetical protein
MMDFSDKLNELLDISNDIQISKTPIERISVETTDNDIEVDYKYARENIYNIIERGHDAIDELMQEAKDSGNARLYEVLGQLIKTVGEQNQNLLNVHKQVKDITKENKTTTNNVTNALFVGSTADLQKMLREKGK